MKEAIYLARAQEILRTRYEEALLNIRRNHLGAAEEELRGMIEDEPGFVPAYNKVGVIAAREKRMEEAQAWFLATLDIDEDYAPALTNLGNIAYERKENGRAEQYYRSAISADAEFGTAYNNLGALLRDEGRVTEAIPLLKQARKLKSYRAKYDPVFKGSNTRGCIFIAAVGILTLLVLFLLLR